MKDYTKAMGTPRLLLRNSSSPQTWCLLWLSLLWTRWSQMSADQDLVTLTGVASACSFSNLRLWTCLQLQKPCPSGSSPRRQSWPRFSGRMVEWYGCRWGQIRLREWGPYTTPGRHTGTGDSSDITHAAARQRASYTKLEQVIMTTESWGILATCWSLRWWSQAHTCTHIHTGRRHLSNVVEGEPWEEDVSEKLGHTEDPVDHPVGQPFGVILFGGTFNGFDPARGQRSTRLRAPSAPSSSSVTDVMKDGTPTFWCPQDKKTFKHLGNICFFKEQSELWLVINGMIKTNGTECFWGSGGGLLHHSHL